MDASHHMGVRELDLRACHPNSLTERINAVPGLKTSTGMSFFRSPCRCSLGSKQYLSMPTLLACRLAPLRNSGPFPIPLVDGNAARQKIQSSVSEFGNLNLP